LRPLPTKEVDLFTREVATNLKPNRQASFLRPFEKAIIPLPRKEHRFADEIKFVSQDGAIAVGISFLKAMDQVVEGTPQRETCEVSGSTWHKIAALKPAVDTTSKAPENGLGNGRSSGARSERTIKIAT
jgi:hypothetical protein